MATELVWNFNVLSQIYKLKIKRSLLVTLAKRSLLKRRLAGTFFSRKCSILPIEIGPLCRSVA
jgi:hypothetical protein